jgi:response regulator RpfG family c-di-GMP phosphodiesterase
MMPRLDGYEVCARLKADPGTRFIPVVMLTALSEVTDKVKGLEAGADDFLNKPFRRQELLARTRSLVKIRRLREELETAENVIFTMVRALESKDPQGAGHSERVAASAMAVAAYLGLSPPEFEAAGRGGMLHDIGKLGVPEDVLWAPRPLSRDAETAYRRHPVLGEKILAPLRSLAASLDVVRHHHDVWMARLSDGLAISDLSAPVEIVAVANLYGDLVRLGNVPAEEASCRLRADALCRTLPHGYRGGVLKAGVAAVGREGRTLVDPWHDLAPVAAAFRTGTILVADDSAASRNALKGMLEDAGFPVIAVESAEAVLPAVMQTKPDLVIIDSRLRDVDGFALCGRIKAQPATEFLPVVLVTAADERRDRGRSAEAGADDFLSVPVNRLELVARVRSLLRLRMYHPRPRGAPGETIYSLAWCSKPRIPTPAATRPRRAARGRTRPRDRRARRVRADARRQACSRHRQGGRPRAADQQAGHVDRGRSSSRSRAIEQRRACAGGFARCAACCP